MTASALPQERDPATAMADDNTVLERVALQMVCPLMTIGQPRTATCRGSACMWWRWSRAYLTPAEDGFTEDGYGYCGIAPRLPVIVERA